MQISSNFSASTIDKAQDSDAFEVVMDTTTSLDLTAYTGLAGTETTAGGVELTTALLGESFDSINVENADSDRWVKVAVEIEDVDNATPGTMVWVINTLRPHSVLNLSFGTAVAQRALILSSARATAAGANKVAADGNTAAAAVLVAHNVVVRTLNK